VVDKNIAFACGQKGVLLRGRADDWEVVNHDSVNEQFWGMEWFNNLLYLATDKMVYVLQSDDTLSPVDMGINEDLTCAKLHANDGLLLSVGRKHIMFTSDGETWESFN